MAIIIVKNEQLEKEFLVKMYIMNPPAHAPADGLHNWLYKNPPAPPADFNNQGKIGA